MDQWERRFRERQAQRSQAVVLPQSWPSGQEPIQSDPPDVRTTADSTERQAQGAAPAPRGKPTTGASGARVRGDSSGVSLLPSIDLLAPIQREDSRITREQLEEQSETLTACLADFGIQGEVVAIHPGPVVTMFEYRPAPGVKISRIANLSDDLALALKALAVRIEAPLSGRDTVGVEIPNAVRQTVYLREILESDAFSRLPSLLSIALGKDISGQPAVTDLARMPHLLVAGATGAGKSVCLNTILVSMLYKTKPDQVKLLLIDPKRIELAVYADLPHLVHPVVTEMTQAKKALDWAVAEMDRPV